MATLQRGDGKDYSAFHVIDVDNLEQVAEYKGKLDTKTYGNMLVSVATEYNDAMLVVENAILVGQQFNKLLTEVIQIFIIHIKKMDILIHQFIFKKGMT